jgi:hypothetical protein
MNFTPPRHDQPDLPPDLTGQFGQRARQLGRDDFVRRDAAPVEMLQSLGLSGLETG